MPLPPALRRAFRTLLGESPLTYVDCGARGGKLPRAFRSVRDSAYVGFEADAEECARLNASARPGHRYIAAFLGRRRERRAFHITASAACSSLLLPNHAFLAAFAELPALFAVEREVVVETVPLDECVAGNGIPQVDVLELDVQGAELEVLQGAEATLRTSVLAVRVEVEFAPMYAGQPLFADVDAFLRDRGFHLFDLSRYRVRRHAADGSMPTRGQLLWGHALYLRDAASLEADRRGRLAVVAALMQVPDYTAGILRDLSADAASPLQRDAQRALAELTPGALVDLNEEPAIAAGINRAQWRD